MLEWVAIIGIVCGVIFFMIPSRPSITLGDISGAFISGVRRAMEDQKDERK